MKQKQELLRCCARIIPLYSTVVGNLFLNLETNHTSCSRRKFALLSCDIAHAQTLFSPVAISSPESFCARLKKRKTLGRSVQERTLIGFYENNTTTGSHSEPNKMAESLRRKLVPVCRCCNCNIVEANHPIYLYGE